MPTYYVDPVNGNDANAGDSFASGHPWKTLKKTFAAGDTILVAKSAESVAAGTVSATNGSVSITTTDNLTGVIAQYTVIRLDDVLYMVRSITSTTITLYRPYRGETGSGKSLAYFTGLPTSATNDWQPTAMVGADGNPITVSCGINTSTSEQDGFTVLYGNNAANLLNGTWTFVDVTNCAMLYFSTGMDATMTDCNFYDLYRFRCASINDTWKRVFVYNMVIEEGYFGYPAAYFDSTIVNLETANTANRGMYLTGINGLVILNWKNSGYSGRNALDLGGNLQNIRIIDAIMDELASGCNMVNVYAEGRFVNIQIQNPNVGSGTLFGVSSGGFIGRLGITHIDGSATDHRMFLGNLESGKYAQVSSDASVYNTAAPSVKVSLFQSEYPHIVKHVIPCEAGIEKTISVYFRKNSSYGGDTTPNMRLRWMTGTAPDLVSNRQDEAMSDVDDTWEQVSYAVTPSVKGTIIVELVFQSANSGAIAWYDDFEVS